MKKILKKLKTTFMFVISFFITLPVKLFAANNDINEQVLYGPPPKSLKNPESISFFDIFIKFISFVYIPLVVIIGLIIYFKKSKSQLKVKILITIGILIIFTLLFIIYYNDFLQYFL